MEYHGGSVIHEYGHECTNIEYSRRGGFETRPAWDLDDSRLLPAALIDTSNVVLWFVRFFACDSVGKTKKIPLCRKRKGRLI